MEYEFRFSKDRILQKLGEDRYFWIWTIIEMKKIKWNFDFVKMESWIL